jgi:fructose-1,6-bisphosphatase I
MMTTRMPLDRYLDRSTAKTAAAGLTVRAIVDAGRVIADLVAAGPLAGNLAAVRSAAREDVQKELDVMANDLIIEALRDAPVAVIASEEMEDPVIVDPGASIAVAVDPLDGSSNIDTNAPIGTIFSILSSSPGTKANPAAPYLRSGALQIAAGYLLYGSHTTLIVTFGEGTQIFTLDRARGEFLMTTERAAITSATREYAINGSNYRHWNDGIRCYVDDCLQGAAGPRAVDFNTRWIASLVAEAYRILVRGGIYLYPEDARPGYGEGRLRLVYEANPIAWLIEQAGGAATDGCRRILDLVPTSLHQRVPLVFGSREEVERVRHYCTDPHRQRERSPLFGQRNLFRV